MTTGNAFEGFAAALEAAKCEWTCAVCGLLFLSPSGAPPEVRLCHGCATKLEEIRQRERVGDMSAQLANAGVLARFIRGGNSAAEWVERFGPMPPAIETWDPRESPMVLLWGKTGRGKTGLATILLERELARGRSGFWIRADRLLWLQQAAISARPGSDAATAAYEATERAVAAHCLVLDDLMVAGSEKPSPFVLGRMNALIAQRYDASAPTIVTTNRRPIELGEILESFGSRLTRGLVVPLTGEDRR